MMDIPKKVNNVKVTMINTCTDHEKVITVPNDHLVVAAALEFFARSERVSIREVELTIKPESN